MIRQSTEIIDMGSQKRNKKANGHAPTPSNDILEPEMEVDDQASIVEDFDEMDTEEADSAIRYDNALEEMIRYGQELKSEFRDDRSRAVEDALKGIFAMFAYVDPRDSPTAFLLDEKGRVPVAEELNSAILGNTPLRHAPWPIQSTKADPSSFSRQVLLRRGRTPLPANESARRCCC